MELGNSKAALLAFAKTIERLVEDNLILNNFCVIGYGPGKICSDVGVEEVSIAFQSIRGFNVTFKEEYNRLTAYDLSDAQRKHLNELVGKLPPLTKEQMKMLDDGERVRRELTEIVMKDIEAKQVRDIFGDLITRETHEVDFDVESEVRDEMCWAVAKNIYVRPKKSEYEK